MLEKCKRVLIDAPSILDYQQLGNTNATRVVLLLHGYGQNSDDIKEALKDVIDDSALWLIPNGVFPMPRRRTDTISYKYAWYFYDNVSERYYIDFEYPATILSKFLKSFGSDREFTIIGYSQGGYLSPFVAQKCSFVSKVIGINCNYRFDMLNDKIDFELNAIHGTQDPLVDPNNSYKSFEQLRTRIKAGEYIKVDGSNHDIDENIIKALKTLF